MTTNQTLGNENAANIDTYLDINQPRLSFYHANAKGTGSAVTFAVTPATFGNGGRLEILFANQKTIGTLNAGGSNLPTFDYDNAGLVELDFTEVAQLLQVLRGELESVNDGRGLYARVSDNPKNTASTVTTFRHVIEPVSGYELALTLDGVAGQEPAKYRIFLGTAEALGLSEALAGSMREIAFGR